MSYKVEVSIAKTIQLRTTFPNIVGEKPFSKNERFRVPSIAADHYVRYRMMEWERKKFSPDGKQAAYHFMTEAHNKHKSLLADRYYRFVLKKFKEMLA